MPCAVYVMPLFRYFTGAFERPRGVAADELSTDPGSDGPADARDRVAAIMRSLGEAAGAEVRWEDDGEVELAELFDPFALHAVRSLAAHQEYPARLLFFRRGFRLLDDPRDHPGLRRIFDGEHTVFPHLMRHSDNKGFYVPAAFDQPVECHEPEWWKIGSVPGVVEELDRLAPHLADTDPRLKEAHDTLRRVFERAQTAGLPVIIDG